MAEIVGEMKNITLKAGLNKIALAGYSYRYTSYTDATTGKKTYLVDAIKGDGSRIAVAKPTMTEAVQDY